MKNYIKIMREMLKRRQFIFGKQNINRHQPYVDDVVINISDEGDVDAVMKFCPSKTDVVNIIRHDISEEGGQPNISEKDIEFVDTFVYSVKKSKILSSPIKLKTVSEPPDPIHSDFVFCVGYLYKLIGGTVNFDGEIYNLVDDNKLFACPGPILTYKGKFLMPAILNQSARSDLEHFPYLEGIMSSDLSLSSEFKVRRIKRVFLGPIVAELDIERTEDQDSIPEDMIPLLGDVVEITPDTMKYVEYKPVAGTEMLDL